jgi:NAD(P)-dependent dehydrogenase (short-subunit alcohol dehydrogenase family)
VHGISTTQAESVARSICDHGGRAVGLAGDLACPRTAASLAEQSNEVLGPIDILVNNAALKTRGKLASTDSAAFDEMIAVNLRARCGAQHRFSQRLLRAARPACVQDKQGGLMTLSRNLVDALGYGWVRVNHLNLGWVLTPSEEAIYRAEGFPEGWPERLPPEIAPNGGLLSPDDVAHFALAFVVNGAVVDLEQFPVVGTNPQKVVELLR